MIKKDCFRCGKTMESVRPDRFQAYKGTQFISHGNYGSTIFDPLTSNEYIEIVICDNCLKENSDNVSYTKTFVMDGELEERKDINKTEEISTTININKTTTWTPDFDEGADTENLDYWDAIEEM